MAKNLNKRVTSCFPLPSIFQYSLLMIFFFLLKLLQHADSNAMYSSDKNANIAINRLRHQFFDNIRIAI